MIDISSPEFVQQLKKGDRQSFEHLYDHYSPNLLGIIHSIVKQNDKAEDILQEAYVKIWKNIDKYNSDKGTFFTWMLNICRNLAIDEYRKIKREKDKVIQEIEDNVHKTDTHMTIDSNSDNTDQIADLKEALKDLPEEQRFVIETLYFNGITQRELAEYKDMPLGTIKSRVRLGMQKLRETLKMILFWI